MSLVNVSCGGPDSPPTSPTPEPKVNVPSISSGTVVSFRSGETGHPVPGASVSLSGESQTGSFSATYRTDDEGQFALDRVVRVNPSPLLEVNADGFLARLTILRSDEMTLTLWPATSLTGLDEAFSSTVVYSSSICPAVNTGQAILRKQRSSGEPIRVALAETLDDPQAMA